MLLEGLKRADTERDQVTESAEDDVQSTKNLVNLDQDQFYEVTDEEDDDMFLG